MGAGGGEGAWGGGDGGRGGGDGGFGGGGEKTSSSGIGGGRSEGGKRTMPSKREPSVKSSFADAIVKFEMTARKRSRRRQ